MRTLLVTLALASVVSSGVLAQDTNRDGQSGEDLYKDACLACHGQDGRGAPQSIVGFDIPLPDFADCRPRSAPATPGLSATSSSTSIGSAPAVSSR